uniref:alanine transaminase n=1 Tax=Spodoptera frugiperda TaxID=7108 RepID=A0A2H1WAX2_SPOFR
MCQVLTRSNIEDIIKFAQKHALFVFADEVYQDNVYDKDSKFYSFKKVMSEMGAPYNKVELVSFMSISKGYVGECGLRGAWMELCNLDPEVQAHLYKAISAMLCSTTLGQTAVDCVGAMYAFPRIQLPPKAIEAAAAANKLPDVFYAFKLLEETGICVVPGSGFGQRPGTYHFRTTILPQPQQLQDMLDVFRSFHAKFTKEYS